MTKRANQPDHVSGGSSSLRGLVSQYRAPMVMLALASLVGAMLEAGFLVLITAVGMALVSGQQEVGPVLGRSLAVNMALLTGAAMLLLRLGFSLAVVQVSARLTAQVTNDQRTMISHAYLGTSWSIQQSEPSGRLQQLLTTFAGRVSRSVTTMTNGVTAALSLVAFLAVALVVDPMSTLAVIAALTLVGLVLTPLRRWIKRRSALSARAALEFANTVSEFGALGQEMQTFGVQRRFTTLVDRMSLETTETQRRVQTLTDAMAPIYMALAYAAVLAGVAALTLLGTGDLGVIGAVLLLMLRSLSYGQQLSTAAATLASNLPFLERIDQAVQEYASDRAVSGDEAPDRAAPIEASDVAFRYVEDRPALSGLTFRFQPGEIVGIIGPSGAGKSTLAQLILGLLGPSQGSVHVGGVDLRDVDRTWWSKRVAFVAQEARLFTGTVAENIRFFREDIDDDAMEWASEQANILKDIVALPEGFQTHLGQRGDQLSGGQRQRLSIARALAGRPDVLVLDEPTSALDGHSEALIRDTLGRLKGRVTVIVIAHRMSTLDICDRIMVVEHGRMTAFGKPSELERDSRYYQKALSIAGIAS